MKREKRSFNPLSNSKRNTDLVAYANSSVGNRSCLNRIEEVFQFKSTFSPGEQVRY